LLQGILVIGDRDGAGERGLVFDDDGMIAVGHYERDSEEANSAIDEAPRDTLEYVMAKIAGETLAATLARTLPNLRTVIERLPRVKTDQTATIFPVPAAAPSALMLPIIRRMSAAA
jgi:hypothetical protein